MWWVVGGDSGGVAIRNTQGKAAAHSPLLLIRLSCVDGVRAAPLAAAIYYTGFVYPWTSELAPPGEKGTLGPALFHFHFVQYYVLGFGLFSS
jgi:hypothetical protein